MAFKKYEDLRFTDDYMFWTVMTQYEEICRQVVELCLGKKVHAIHYKEGQKSIKTVPASKGIRLDVYLEDAQRTLYDIEMQNVSQPFMGRRIRYYTATMDVNNLYEGMDYEELPDAYVVFICMFDPFGAGQAVYEFERREKVRTDLCLEYGTRTILINPYGDDRTCSSEMKAFLSYLRGESGEEGLGNQIDEAVRQVKRHEKWREGYMKYEADMMDQRRAGRAEGREEGFEKGLAEGLREGHSAGLEEGRSAGHSEGKREGRSERTSELCDRMIRQEFSDGQIASLLEIPAEEIVMRRRELQQV